MENINYEEYMKSNPGVPDRIKQIVYKYQKLASSEFLY